MTFSSNPFSMPKAYSYIRFSTPEQVKGDSLRRQVELSEKYANEHGLELDTTVTFRDLGISAYDQSNVQKGALGLFLKLVEQGKIPKGSYLLVENLDRLSRATVMDALEIFTSILNAGVTIVTLGDNQKYSREAIKENWSALVYSILIMVRASEESATKSIRTRSSWDQKRKEIRQRILTARCPYWMRPKPDRQGFELIPERVEIVKRILQMAKDGMGNSLIAKTLNEAKVSPFSNKTDGWHPTYIQKMLRSTSLYGELVLHLQRDGTMQRLEDSIDNYYPPVITKEEWLFINQRRMERTTKGGAHKGEVLSNLFSGLLVCGHCFGSMTMSANRKKLPSGGYRVIKYIACSRARRGLGCKHIMWPYEDLEQKVLRFCHSIDFVDVLGKTSGARSAAEEAESRSLGIAKTIDENNQKLKNLLDVLETGEDRPDIIVARIKDLEQQNKQLSIEYERSKQEAAKLFSEATEEAIQKEALLNTLDALDNYQGTDLHTLRLKLSAQIKRILESIVLHPGGFWISDIRLNSMVEGLKQAGISKKMRDQYLPQHNEINKDDRFLSIIFKNGETLSFGKDKVVANSAAMSLEQYAEYRKIRSYS